MDAATKLRLKEGAAALGVPLGDDQLARLERHHQLLSTWNSRINLTAITDPAEVVERHYLDSLAVVPHLGPIATLVDAGAGAGFPGSVIAIARPELRVTCVESIRKKVAFLQTLKREVAPNLEPVCARIETVQRTFDAAISRATWDPAEWLTIGARLAPIVIAMQGAEQPDLPPPAGFRLRRAVPYAANRRLLIFERST
jgi:16S rRNA (guanine527-N7)-methyltransferase